MTLSDDSVHGFFRRCRPLASRTADYRWATTTDGYQWAVLVFVMKYTTQYDAILLSRFGGLHIR